MPQATVLAPGQGEKYWIVGDHITFKVGPNESGGKYAVATNVAGPGGGPPPHIHANEDEMFYVLSGKMLFMDNTQTFVGGPGTAVYLKKGIPHTFKNIGDTDAHFIVTTTPTGFEAFVKECGEAITQIPSGLQVNPAAIDKLMAHAGKHGVTMLFDHKPTGEKKFTPAKRDYWVLGQHVSIKLGSAETGGNFSVAEVTQRPGDFVPPHLHVAMDEYFYVIEGQFEFSLDGKHTPAPAGTFVHVPKGVMHGFANKSNAPAKLVDYHTPGGFEAFFQECGVPAADASKPPTLGPPDMAKLMALFKKHGMELAK